MNNRRKLVMALGAGVLAAPFDSFAQQPERVWRVGFITSFSRQVMLESGRLDSFMQGMRKLGYVEGKSLAIEWRFADDKLERLPGMAAELVALKPDVIVAGGSPAIRAMQKATATIPIVMSTGDPVGSGFVASLARPGGNITGLSTGNGDVSAKYLELLMSVTPKLSRVAILGDTGSSTHGAIVKNVRAAAQRTGVTVMQVDVRTQEEIVSSFTNIAREHANGVITAPTPLVIEQGRQIAELAAKFRIPTIYGYGRSVDAGGLMSYASNLNMIYGKLATYVDKILKGAKPADLPVEQPNEFELVVNLKTAKALGITFPPSILARADRVIE